MRESNLVFIVVQHKLVTCHGTIAGRTWLAVQEKEKKTPQRLHSTEPHCAPLSFRRDRRSSNGGNTKESKDCQCAQRELYVPYPLTHAHKHTHLKVSAAARSTFWSPSSLSRDATLPTVVVFPMPLAPMKNSTDGPPTAGSAKVMAAVLPAPPSASSFDGIVPPFSTWGRQKKRAGVDLYNKKRVWRYVGLLKKSRKLTKESPHL